MTEGAGLRASDAVFIYPRQRKRVKATLFTAQAGRCCYCGRAIDLAPKSWGIGNPAPDHFATLEHLQRVADGGRSTRDNLALACFRCNTTRGDLNWCEFKTMMEPKP
jgi:5-methylcytosine-specific restriction endonuclease McrA